MISLKVFAVVVALGVTNSVAQPLGSCCISNCSGSDDSRHSACRSRYTEAECVGIATFPYFGVTGCRGDWTQDGACGAQGSACFPPGTAIAACKQAFGGSTDTCVTAQGVGCYQGMPSYVSGLQSNCCQDGATRLGACPEDPPTPAPPPPRTDPPPTPHGPGLRIGDCYERDVPEMLRCRRLGTASVRYSRPTEVHKAQSAYAGGERFLPFDETTTACQAAIVTDSCVVTLEAFRCYVAVRPCLGFAKIACSDYLQALIDDCPTVVSACGIMEAVWPIDLQALADGVACPTPLYQGKEASEPDGPPLSLGDGRDTTDDHEDDDGIIGGGGLFSAASSGTSSSIGAVTTVVVVMAFVDGGGNQ